MTPAEIAALRGVPRPAVHKASRKGWLDVEPDGSIDPDTVGNALWIGPHQRGCDDSGRALSTHWGGRKGVPYSYTLLVDTLLADCGDEETDVSLADAWLSALRDRSGLPALAAVLASLPRQLRELREEIGCLKSCKGRSTG
jgi:hypothetical protein